MKLNEAGINLIKHYESCSLKAYPDPASPMAAELRKLSNQRRPGWEKMSGDPWTVGWGSTGTDRYAAAPIDASTTWTQEQADKRLAEDLNVFSAQVANLVKVELTDNQFSALVSFAYNVGASNLKSSTLLQLVNRGKHALAADEFPKWNKAKGKVLAGLTARRDAERRLYLTP